MPQVYLRTDLYNEIVKGGQDVGRWVNDLVAKALEAERKRRK